mgnify:CR=1 FL=1
MGINFVFFIIFLLFSFLLGLLPGALIGFFYGKINPEYNPFRMWGGWVLGIIGVLNQLRDGIDIVRSTVITDFIVFVFFFIVGWGIHSLIKELKQNKSS